MAPVSASSSKKPASKQASLFSFFAKKEKVESTPETGAATPQPSQSSSSSTAPAAAPAALQPVAASEAVTPGHPSLSPESGEQGSSGPCRRASWGPEVVGRRLSVFWPEDDEYYAGVVTGYSKEDGRHTLKYDDGDEERVMLSNETLRWEGEGEAVEVQVKRPLAPSAPARKVGEVDEDDDDEEEDETPIPRKRRTVVLEDEESSESEMELDNLSATPSVAGKGASASQGGVKRKDSGTPASAQVERDSSSSGKRTRFATETPVVADKSRSSSSASSVTKTPASSSASKAKLLFSTPASSGSSKGKGGGSAGAVTPMDVDEAAGSSSPSASQLPEGTLESGKHLHHMLDWLYKNRRDGQRKLPTDPDYDPRTLYVPPDFLKKETPAMRQWWEFKSKNFDTLLFFKVGKFYEIFHQDADVAVKELDLIYMKGDKAHSGFPESAFAKYASILVDRGYRVARVEQTETPEMMKEHNRTAGRTGEKRTVVQRELCSVMSKGTRTFCYLDESLDEGDPVGPLLIGIKEREEPAGEGTGEEGEEETAARVMYGVCMVDPNTGAFRLGQFEDDQQRCRLRTMLSQFSPAEVLLEKGVGSPALEQMVRFCAPGAIVDQLKSGSEFWSCETTLKELKKGGYFPRGSKQQGGADGDDEDAAKGTSRWPAVLQLLVGGGEHGELALSALGAVVWQLRRSLIEHDLLSMQSFSGYAPPDVATGGEAEGSMDAGEEKQEEEEEEVKEALVLDGTTLSNLEVFRNSYDRGSKGSLWEYMNRCLTPFGARKFREWMCKPLRSITAINARLDAVSELMDTLLPEADGVRAILKKMPDLERQLARHHTLGSLHRSSEHPDSRAIMYETKQYNARKIADFLSCLDGLRASSRIKAILDSSSISSPLLQKIARCFPNMEEKLQFFSEAFDPVKAKKESVITPRPGVDPEYDQAKQDIADVNAELDAYLKEQRKRLGCDIVYWGSGKDRFQLEVPESALRKHEPAEYDCKSSKKNYKRFHTPRIRELLDELIAAEERLAEALRDEMRRLFEKFDSSREVWSAAVQCMAMLDCLLSLAEVSASPDFSRPELTTAEQPFITIQNGRHPCLAAAARNDNFIPNDVSLGEQSPSIMLLSGPNMGGKSTLLRQTCVLAIMAQMGCYVPAESLRMTPVDRIFTRVGASDRILQGQSTFFVELSETANILQNATAHSLVILDELGRGTSTFDGTAIAHAVVKFLIERVQCRTLFATHYHSLVEDWRGSDRVCFGHMACMVEPDGDEQKVTFLYRLAEGPSPKSYGINVARLAHLPKEVIRVAKEKSEKFESTMASGGADPLLHLGAEVMALVEAGGDAETTLATARRLWTEWNM